MTEKILLALAIIIVAPILAFLCMKLGTVGFYRGKEVSKRESRFDVEEEEEDNNNNNEIEN